MWFVKFGDGNPTFSLPHQFGDGNSTFPLPDQFGDENPTLPDQFDRDSDTNPDEDSVLELDRGGARQWQRQTHWTQDMGHITQVSCKFYEFHLPT